MPHKILQRLWIHACLRLIATVGMSAHMRRDVRHLSATGEVSYKDNLTDEDKEYIDSITTVTTLPEKLITGNFAHYINMRYSHTAV